MTIVDFMQQTAIQVMAAFAVNEDADAFDARREQIAEVAVRAAEALAEKYDEDHVFSK